MESVSFDNKYAQHSTEQLERLLSQTKDSGELQLIADELAKRLTKHYIDMSIHPPKSEPLTKRLTKHYIDMSIHPPKSEPLTTSVTRTEQRKQVSDKSPKLAKHNTNQSGSNTDSNPSWFGSLFIAMAIGVAMDEIDIDMIVDDSTFGGIIIACFFLVHWIRH